ncbi:hypothetical protein [Streptomyces aquilus]|nr:hypothetical protein [Streptomyces aquilus]
MLIDCAAWQEFTAVELDDRFDREVWDAVDDAVSNGAEVCHAVRQV